MSKVVLFILLLMSYSSFSQVKDNTKKIELGLEYEQYPVGHILVLTSNIFLKENLAFRLRVGGNFAHRGNRSGFNDNEIAKGYGISTGIVKYFPVKGGNIIAGFATDFWIMKTDWTDNSVTGTTTNLVIQPWINSGYLFTFSNVFNAGMILGFGREINTFNKGEQVGQGLMGSISLLVNFKLN